MAQTITIAGATYSDVPSVLIPKDGGGTATFTDVSDTTAVASDVSTGKYFYGADGTLTQGTNQGVVPIIMRPDAAFVTSFTYDKKIHADEEITIPAYTTTATVLKASETLTTTVTMDLVNYTYYILERALTIPEYNISTVGKGRVEFSFFSSMYEIVDFDIGEINSLIDPTLHVKAKSTSVYQGGNCARLNYYNNATTLASYATAAYGTYQTVTAPTIKSGVLTIKTPALGVRGHTTYFTETYFNALTDIRYQYVIEVYRAPRNHLSFDGWPLYTQALGIIDCVNSSTRKLT